MFRRIISALTAVCMSFICIPVSDTFSAQATTSTPTVTVPQKETIQANGEVELSIMPDVVNPGEPVTVHIVLTKNPGINSAEFGIHVNARNCQVQVNPDLTMIIPEYDEQNGMIWFTWVTGNKINQGTNILDIYIPYESIEDDNWYPVDYVSQMNGRRSYWTNVNSEILTTVFKNLTIVKDLLEISDVPISSPIVGDVNSDGIIDIMDVIALNKFVLGVRVLSTNQRKAADVDMNNMVDSTDALDLLKYIIELIPSLPVTQIPSYTEATTTTTQTTVPTQATTTTIKMTTTSTTVRTTARTTTRTTTTTAKTTTSTKRSTTTAVRTTASTTTRMTTRTTTTARTTSRTTTKATTTTQAQTQTAVDWASQYNQKLQTLSGSLYQQNGYLTAFYGLYDLTGDGVPELFYSYGDHTLHGYVYTCDGNTCRTIGDIGMYTEELYIISSKRMIVAVNSHYGRDETNFYQLGSNGLMLVETLLHEYDTVNSNPTDWWYRNGVQITQSAYNQRVNYYNNQIDLTLKNNLYCEW